MSDGDAPAQRGGGGGQRRPAAISVNTLRCFSIFLFQVVRAYSGELDEGVKTAPIRPRHGRWRRLAEVVETARSLSLRPIGRSVYKTLLSVRRNVSRAQQVVLLIGIKVVICSIPLSRSLFPLRSRRRESDNVVHIILPTIGIRAHVRSVEEETMAKKSADGEVGAATPSLKLSKTNYRVWSMTMEVYLDSHDLWQTIVGENPTKKKDRQALSAIMSGVPEELLGILDARKTVKEKWEILRQWNLRVDRVIQSRIQGLRRDLEVLTMGKAKTVVDFAMKFRHIVSDL